MLGAINHIPGDPIPRINGRKPINSKHANSNYPSTKLPSAIQPKYPHGVDFTPDGFPDFAPHASHSVPISGMKGDHYHDFNKANTAAGLPDTPNGYTWHHKEDGITMQLVPTDLHDAVKHTGYVAISK